MMVEILNEVKVEMVLGAKVPLELVVMGGGLMHKTHLVTLQGVESKAIWKTGKVFKKFSKVKQAPLRGA